MKIDGENFDYSKKAQEFKKNCPTIYDNVNK